MVSLSPMGQMCLNTSVKRGFFFNVIFIFCFSCCQSTREAEIKLKSESRVKLFYLDPDAQVRTIF